jgi:hypothetical protein
MNIMGKSTCLAMATTAKTSANEEESSSWSEVAKWMMWARRYISTIPQNAIKIATNHINGGFCPTSH